LKDRKEQRKRGTDFFSPYPLYFTPFYDTDIRVSRNMGDSCHGVCVLLIYDIHLYFP
jgi:hypothetical protein